MEADKINKTKDGDSDGFSEPMNAGDDISSVRKALNMNSVQNSNLKRKASTKGRDVDQNDFEIGGKSKDNALEIYE